VHQLYRLLATVQGGHSPIGGWHTVSVGSASARQSAVGDGRGVESKKGGNRPKAICYRVSKQFRCVGDFATDLRSLDMQRFAKMWMSRGVSACACQEVVFVDLVHTANSALRHSRVHCRRPLTQASRFQSRNTRAVLPWCVRTPRRPWPRRRYQKRGLTGCLGPRHARELHLHTTW